MKVQTVAALGHETILHCTTELDVVTADSGSVEDKRGDAVLLAAVLPGHHTFSCGTELRLGIDINRLSLFTPDGVAVA